MTREEERKVVANEYVKHFFDNLELNIDNYPTDAIISRDDFIKGAEWADEHPPKGMVDIEKACEWLKDNAKYYSHPKYQDEELTDETYISEQLFYDFCKAMKGE